MLRTEGSQERLDNLAELKQSVYEYETTCGEECTLEHYLAHVALFTNADAGDSSDRVKQMIERQKSRYGWEFLFLGANIDAVETAGHFGIDADRAVNYHSDSEGTALNYEVLSETICAVRCSQPLGCDWKKRIDEDFYRRR